MCCTLAEKPSLQQNYAVTFTVTFKNAATALGSYCK
jgi:hypothetical protein